MDPLELLMKCSRYGTAKNLWAKIRVRNVFGAPLGRGNRITRVQLKWMELSSKKFCASNFCRFCNAVNCNFFLTVPCWHVIDA